MNTMAKSTTRFVCPNGHPQVLGGTRASERSIPNMIIAAGMLLPGSREPVVRRRLKCPPKPLRFTLAEAAEPVGWLRLSSAPGATRIGNR